MDNAIPCELCGTPTEMLGTGLCDRCWELRSRIERDPEIARRILETVEQSKAAHKK